MDIRGFTRWSESKDPETAVTMLNQFYQLAESVIVDGGGQKPHFIGDEVMTWFADPQQAVHTARLLRSRMNQMLRPYDLSVGAGLHLGEVVEGLMGSEATRSYNIIGDTVNTASHLVSAAGAGELLISESVAQSLALAENGHFCAEAGVHLGEFDADVAAADDDERRGHGLQQRRGRGPGA